ncbi:FAS1 domain-containing protein SELMODRAFT_448915-like [Lycium barbarum]|uniref:FAS1 domain-containing protein SELMODRAFT_448915-like n=1 Tax=Lycium barbarum TaxID=112863 RepID=UPI00293E4E01|nr:FAS1 domain-containing protein SELMODRAFT_448915-like [Lycium barbarum]
MLFKEPTSSSSLTKEKPDMTRIHMFLTFLLMLLISSVSTATNSSQDILQATEEMRKANYFTFVMLINMAPADLIQGNITFLMPRDRTLSQTLIQENDVEDFLLRHSIPSPLLFDHLEHFPTGSMIPTSKPDLVLRVTNSGNMRFFLNNARVISPNICTKTASIRCHGIDQVLEDNTLASDHNASLPVPLPSHNVTSPPLGLSASPPVISPPSAAQPISSSINPIPSSSPPLKSAAQSAVALRQTGITGLIWLLMVVKLSF